MNDMTKFNYSLLPTNFQQADIEYLEQCAVDVEIGGRITIEGIFRMGKRLNEARSKFGENDKAFGQWRKGRLPWLETDTAVRFMQVERKFSSENLLPHFAAVEKLAPSVLYALSAPSTPESVIDKAVAKAESGEKVTVADVRDWKALEAELEIEKRRNREWMEQSKANRDKIRALELDLSAALDRPVPKPEIQVVEKTPADYEAFKARAVSMAEEIATLKKKQVDLVQQQVTAKLREREKEIAELDRQVRSAEALLASLNQQIDSYSSIERMTRLQRDLIEKTRSALVDLASHLEGLTPLENDPETDRLWDALADMLRNGAAAVEYFLGNAKPALTVIRGSAA